MRKAFLAMAVLGMLVGAGASSPVTGGPAGLVEVGCLGIHGFFYAAAGNTQALMPAGFAAAFGNGQLVRAHAAVHACEGAQVDGVAVGPYTWVVVDVAVTPPEEYLAEHVDFYAVPWFSVSGPEVAARLAAWGFGGQGPAALTVASDEPAGLRLGTGEIRGAAVSLAVAGAGTFEDNAAYVVRFFSGAPGGPLEHMVDTTFHAAGRQTPSAAAATTWPPLFVERALAGPAYAQRSGPGVATATWDELPV